MKKDEESFVVDLAERQINSRVSDAETLYSQTGDGRYFWRAFLALHEAGRPIPPSMLDKLGQIGTKLLLSDRSAKLATALEFSGGKKRYVGVETSRAYERRWEIASSVMQLKKLYNLSLAQAFSDVARYRGLSVAKVKSDFYKVSPSSGRLTRTSTDSKNLFQAMRTWMK